MLECQRRELPKENIAPDTHILYKIVDLSTMDYTTFMKVVAQNRRARFEYEILETIEAGIILTGSEAKSCRMGHLSIAGSYVSFYKGIAQLKNAKITKYAFSGPSVPHEDSRDRTLLLKKHDIEKLQSSVAEKGIAIIPLEVKAGKFIKVLLGIGRGRKRYDKRQKIKERDVSRRVREGREE
jgi:SsrA-binding protein